MKSLLARGSAAAIAVCLAFSSVAEAKPRPAPLRMRPVAGLSDSRFPITSSEACYSFPGEPDCLSIIRYTLERLLSPKTKRR